MDEGAESIPQPVSRQTGIGEKDREIIRTAANRSSGRKGKKAKVEKKEESQAEIFTIGQV